MAFSGLHVVCGFAGSSIQRDKSQAILGKTLWSEAPSTGVTSTNLAPSVSDSNGQPLFRIRASADAWVSVGASPNATSGTRFFVPANEDYDKFVEPGDKLQWSAA